MNCFTDSLKSILWQKRHMTFRFALNNFQKSFTSSWDFAIAFWGIFSCVQFYLSNFRGTCDTYTLLSRIFTVLLVRQCSFDKNVMTVMICSCESNSIFVSLISVAANTWMRSFVAEAHSLHLYFHTFVELCVVNIIFAVIGFGAWYKHPLLQYQKQLIQCLMLVVEEDVWHMITSGHVLNADLLIFVLVSTWQLRINLCHHTA